MRRRMEKFSKPMPSQELVLQLMKAEGSDAFFSQSPRSLLVERGPALCQELRAERAEGGLRMCLGVGIRQVLPAINCDGSGVLGWSEALAVVLLLETQAASD